MCPQRHPLPQTRHDERISNTQQGEILRERQILGVEEYDGLVGEGGETRVDAGDDVGDASCEFVGFGRLEGDLD